MRKFRHYFFVLICFCLLMGSADNLIPRAYAASTMTASESCVDFIKKAEGFSAKPYYDYGQHTVGYGTKCPMDKYFDYMTNGISREEAEVLLRETLVDVADDVNKKLIDPYNLTFTQHQFDALVSFSFNLGTGWMTYDSTLRNAILRSGNADDLVYAFSLYSTAGGYYSSGLITRRLCEANLYLNGVYSQSPGKTYGYVFYEPNGGNLTYRVQGFVCDTTPAPKADAVQNGKVFLGWYTDLTGGTQVTKLTSALSGKTLFARWQATENSENQNTSSTVIRVTGDVVNIRKGPGTNYGISKQVYRNDTLIVSHITQLLNQKWGKVQDGWICIEYTNYDNVINGTDTPDPESNRQPTAEPTLPDVNDTQTKPDIHPDNENIVQGIVRVGDLLRIRSGPGTAYSKVGYLQNGSKVEILEQKTVGSMVWGRIAQGWISMDYIATEQLPTDPPTEPDTEHKQETEPEQEATDPADKSEPTAIKGTISADALRIRSGPGSAYSVVGFYYQKDTVVISEKVQKDSAYWGKTDKGWISMDYVLTDSPNTEPSPAPGAELRTVIADCLRVRKEIGTNSRIAALLYRGDKVTVTETKTVDGTLWGKVDKGWICMDYVD